MDWRQRAGVVHALLGYRSSGPTAIPGNECSMGFAARRCSAQRGLSMLKIGSKVRPVGDHIAKSHVGEVYAFTTPYDCPTCGTSILRKVRVLWADGRRGDWTPESLIELPNGSVQ